MNNDKNNTVTIAVLGALIIILLFIAGTVWTGKTAKSDLKKLSGPSAFFIWMNLRAAVNRWWKATLMIVSGKCRSQLT